MPSLSPTPEDTNNSSSPVHFEDTSKKLHLEEEAQTKTETQSSSVFFSRTAVATAFVGIALAVTAYFAPPVAIAATLALGAVGLVYYGVTAFLAYNQENTTASTGTETPSSTPDAENDAKNEKSPSRTSSYNSVNSLLPDDKKTEEETKDEQLRTTPVSESQDVQDNTTKRERSNSHDSQDSHHSSGSTLSMS